MGTQELLRGRRIRRRPWGDCWWVTMPWTMEASTTRIMDPSFGWAGHNLEIFSSLWDLTPIEPQPRELRKHAHILGKNRGLLAPSPELVWPWAFIYFLDKISANFNKGNFIWCGVRRPEEEALTLYHSSSIAESIERHNILHSPQKEARTLLPRHEEGRFFSLPGNSLANERLPQLIQGKATTLRTPSFLQWNFCF